MTTDHSKSYSAGYLAASAAASPQGEYIYNTRASPPLIASHPPLIASHPPRLLASSSSSSPPGRFEATRAAYPRGSSPPPSAPLADAVSLLNQRVSKLREQVLCLQDENHNLKLDAERRRASERALEEENRALRTELAELSHVSREEVQSRARRAAFAPGRKESASVDSLDHSLRASRKLDTLLYEQV